MYFPKQIQQKTMTFKLYQTRYKITTKKNPGIHFTRLHLALNVTHNAHDTRRQ